MIKSAYGVLFKHFFIPELFFGDFAPINKAFHFLNNKNCIKNLIYAGCTDFNLNHPEFWRHSISHMHSEEKQLLKNVLNKHNIEYRGNDLETWFWHLDSVSEELKSDLIKELYPDSLEVNNPFVKNLGSLTFSRAAIPFIQRKCAFRFFSYEGLGSSFGMNGINDYRYAHIPISVRIGKKCKLVSIPKDPNFIAVRNNTMFINCKIRIHIFPYGLITTYFIYSISAKKPIQLPELIETVNRLLCDNNNSISFIFKDKSFNSISHFVNFIITNILDSIYKDRPFNFPKTSRLYSFLSLNIQKEYRSKTALRLQDIVKVLTLDTTTSDYSPSFLQSYSSSLGKYVGDFAFFSSEKVLMSLTTQWENYRKRKTKVRYYWLFIHLYQFITSIRYLSQSLLTVLHDNNFSKKAVTTEDVTRINQWIKFVGRQHSCLNPVYRKFYHNIYELQSVKQYLDELRSNINEHFSKQPHGSFVKVEELNEQVFSIDIRSLREKIETGSGEKKLKIASADLIDEVIKIEQIGQIDPEAAIAKARKVIEIIISDLYHRYIANKGKHLHDMIKTLYSQKLLPKKIWQYFETIRNVGNLSVHYQLNHTDKCTATDLKLIGIITSLIVDWYITSNKKK